MKLCRNIHRSVWQLLGLKKIQNGGRCHGNQGVFFFSGRHFDFFSTHKRCHTLQWIFLQSFVKFDEWNPKGFQFPPFFVSMTTNFAPVAMEIKKGGI
jgi:hypothetical protein